MPRSFAIALIVLVVAPLVLLGWLMSLTLRNQRIETRQRLTGIFESRLEEMDQRIAARLQQTQRQILQAIESWPDLKGVELVEQIEQHQPSVRRGLWISAQNVLVYPGQPLSEQSDTVALYAGLKGLAMDRLSPASEEITSKVSAAAFWQVWYFDQGLQLVLWLPQSDGSTIGFLLERGRWLADVLSVLPDTPETLVTASDRGDPGFTALVDSSGRLVYRWGTGDESEQSLGAEVALSEPLSAWRLRYYSDLRTLTSGPSRLGWMASLVGIGLLLLTLGGYIATGVSRQMRSARQRVSFAGQVSHELRTPLTNIRLYAELAESDVAQLPAGARRDALQNRLKVIESESRRLTRLVSGVLEWVSERGRQRPLRLQPVNPDELIDQAIEQFQPSFAAANLTVNRTSTVDQAVALDVDIIELILVNLLSNVEKYAGSGDAVDVLSELDGPVLRIVVRDHGPGIPTRHHQYVFKAFSRLDHSVSAPSGTGIGLSIARTAARRHGGDLRLLPHTDGASFELTIPLT